VKSRELVTAQCGKIRPMYLLLGDNDSVPISVWHGGGMQGPRSHGVQWVI